MSAYSDYSNAAAQGQNRALISVLIPFYRDNPLPIMSALSAQIADQSEPFEIVVFDDGKPDTELNESVLAFIDQLGVPARLLTARQNVGRASGRNRLASAAIGEWLLYLDADMSLPENYLTNWVELVEGYLFDAAFGGYTADAATSRKFRLHEALAKASDEHDAQERSMLGATAFCTSNLLVKADLMRSVQFDSQFTGWGWEDVDWAVRADHHGALVHVDNPAGHCGWQTADVLLDKFKDAAKNYARLLQKHPELAYLPSAKAARFLKAIPGQALMRGLWAIMAKSEIAPMSARTTALKLWRASWAAEAI